MGADGAVPMRKFSPATSFVALATGPITLDDLRAIDKTIARLCTRISATPADADQRMRATTALERARQELGQAAVAFGMISGVIEVS